MSQPRILLTGFSDEIVADKNVDIQFAVFSALGLRYTTLRFLRVDNQIVNVSQLTDQQADFVAARLEEFGLQASSIGSPLGKIKLLDREDSTQNRFCPFDDYLKSDVRRVCELSQRFSTRLIRGFSFYHPRGERPEDFVSLVVERLAQIAETCGEYGLIYGLEVEANLVGQNGHLLAEIYRQVNHPALALIFDSANLVVQGYSGEQVIEQWHLMKPGLGWLHVKDYMPVAANAPGSHVDEESLAQFVPAGHGAGDYREIFADIRDDWNTISERLQELRLPGLYVDLEPHLLSGGQFGGHSGPQQFGVATRALTGLLHSLGLTHEPH